MAAQLAELSQIQTPKALAQFIRDALGTTSAMITIPRQFEAEIVECAGQELPGAFAKRLPWSHSVCRHVAEMNFPLVVDDAFSHPLLQGHPAVERLGVAAYLGVPVRKVGNGHNRMVLCALNNHQRRWRKADIGLLLESADHLDTLYSG